MFVLMSTTRISTTFSFPDIASMSSTVRNSVKYIYSYELSTYKKSYARSDAFIAVKIQVVIWVVTLHNFVVGCQHFRGLCSLHLQGEVTLKMEAAQTSEMIAFYHNTSILLHTIVS